MSNRNSEMQVVSAVEQFSCSGTVRFCGLGCQGCLRPLNRVVSPHLILLVRTIHEASVLVHQVELV